MAKAGDYYVVKLHNSPLDWGEYRYTSTRKPIEGEGYIPIPKKKAKEFKIYNSNGTNGEDELGKNIFRYRTADGRLNGFLRAQGCSKKGDIYAKQFSADGNLKIIGSWFSETDASTGTKILVEWKTPTEIIISKVNN